MIWINENLLIDYQTKGSLEVKIEAQKKLNEKFFTVGDTNLSYRQINSLDEGNMLFDKRANERGWRKFSFKDLVYLYTINEFRKYGIENSKLQEVKDDFYRQDKGEAKFSNVDHVLLLVLAGIKISLLLDSSGKCWFCDLNLEAFLGGTSTSYINVNFNEIVKNAWKVTHKGDDSKFAKYKDWGDFIEDYVNKGLISSKEQEILNIIRNKEYSLITIKKKDSGTFNVYGEIEKRTEGLTEVKLLEAMKEKDFTNIKITKRDGKVVSYKLEDVYKI